jgi:hypothetical protein
MVSAEQEKEGMYNRTTTRNKHNMGRGSSRAREREGERLTHVQMVIGEVSERERAYDEGLVVEGLVVAATQQARVRSADRTHASVLGKTEAMTRNNGIAKVSIKNNWPAPRGVPACRSR